MPRGFLVKRTKRGGPLSYRVREDWTGPGTGPSPWGGQGKVPVRPACSPCPAGPACSPGMPESPRGTAGSPDRPGGSSSPGRPLSSSSPVQAESFPGQSGPDQEGRMGSSCGATKGRPQAGKARGLRPRLEEPDTRLELGLREGQLRGQCPLGGFVCQLCKEEYPAALALAQHRCSQIAQVEYRCHVCDKLFSCPANLASHCRWHKPRAPTPAQCRDPSPRPGEHPTSEKEPFHCPLCGKRFRRQAYLRKHTATHRAPALLLPEGQRLGPEGSVPKPRAAASLGRSQSGLQLLCSGLTPVLRQPLRVIES